MDVNTYFSEFSQTFAALTDRQKWLFIGLPIAVIILLTIIARVIEGIITVKMNGKKGISGGFAWGFFLGIAGIIVVALRPYAPRMYRLDSQSGR